MDLTIDRFYVDNAFRRSGASYLKLEYGRTEPKLGLAECQPKQVQEIAPVPTLIDIVNIAPVTPFNSNGVA